MNSEAGERIKWRPHFNQLIARPIPKTEFPKIINRMWDDGLICLLSTEGHQWYSGRYRVSAAAVREIWGLSVSQWSRFMGWVYSTDPFSKYDGKDISEESSKASSRGVGEE